MNGGRSLAVVVIARNEERTIGACLQACIEAASLASEGGHVDRTEVILVDSASTDRTREIAAQLPVRLVALPSDWPLSAAAGRFVGVRSTDSELVLFVDGDFVLEPSWIEVGLKVLEDPAVAAVCGVDREALVGRTSISRYVGELSARSVPVAEVVEAEAIPVGLYRRAWIARAGGIQPFLKGAEDRDLAMRLRARGARLLKTRAVMGTHHWSPGEDLNLVEYLRSVLNWSFGEGQAARSAEDGSLQRAYLRRYANVRHLLQAGLGLGVFAWVALVAGLLALGQWWLAGATLILAVGAAFLSSRNQPLRDTIFRLHQIPYVLVRISGFLMGFLRRPPPASDYPR